MKDREVALAIGGLGILGAAMWAGVSPMIFLPCTAAFALWYILR